MTTESQNKVFKKSKWVKDISGMSFGKLSVESFAYSMNSRSYWNCTCKCGNKYVGQGKSIISGLTRSCGCLSAEVTSKRSRTHGGSQTPEYAIWAGMISRCENPNNSAYKHYGAIGIKVCRRWRNSFDNFINDMGKRPVSNRKREYSIERINRKKGYYPSNCKWATYSEQQNNKSNNTLLKFNGVTQTIAQWSSKNRIPYGTLLRRIKAGWQIERILTKPTKRL